MTSYIIMIVVLLPTAVKSSPFLESRAADVLCKSAHLCSGPYQKFQVLVNVRFF